ncbi:MAG: hypothetical protein LBR11_01630 [Deltaproteobacteria bacterium]|jgi:hypothetical protein|nr:hypothetical protein [Deltaproteobacteria bacterium]
MDEFEQNLAGPLAETFSEGLFKNSGCPDFASFHAALISPRDGYSWNGVGRVFNPFSLMSPVSDMELEQYWLASRTPSFLVKCIKFEPAKALRFDIINMS